MRAAAQPLSAFSLLEMLIVLALIIILTVMTTGRMTTSARKRELSACAGNLQKIYLALGFYRNDNGAWPSLPQALTAAEPLSLLVPKGTTDTAIFICPGSGDKPLPESVAFGRYRISYDYYMGLPTNSNPQDVILSDWQANTLPKRKGALLFSPDGKEPANNHGPAGGNLLSCDGSVVFSKPKADRDLLFSAPVKLLGP